MTPSTPESADQEVAGRTSVEASHRRPRDSRRDRQRPGTDRAVREEPKLKYKGLKKQARHDRQDRRRRGLTLEDLADRLVPDSASTAMASSCSTWVRRPSSNSTRARSLAGARRRQATQVHLKAGADDDPELVDRAKRELAGLRKDIKSIAKEQLARHERGMVDERRWSVEDAQRYFIEHPLTWTIAQRLVWGARRLRRAAVQFPHRRGPHLRRCRRRDARDRRPPADRHRILRARRRGTSSLGRDPRRLRTPNPSTNWPARSSIRQRWEPKST